MIIAFLAESDREIVAVPAFNTRIDASLRVGDGRIRSFTDRDNTSVSVQCFDRNKYKP